jgi:hypothetical protein
MEVENSDTDMNASCKALRSFIAGFARRFGEGTPGRKYVSFVIFASWRFASLPCPCDMAFQRITNFDRVSFQQIPAKGEEIRRIWLILFTADGACREKSGMVLSEVRRWGQFVRMCASIGDLIQWHQVCTQWQTGGKKGIWQWKAAGGKENMHQFVL